MHKYKSYNIYIKIIHPIYIYIYYVSIYIYIYYNIYIYIIYIYTIYVYIHISRNVSTDCRISNISQKKNNKLSNKTVQFIFLYLWRPFIGYFDDIH